MTHRNVDRAKETTSTTGTGTLTLTGAVDGFTTLFNSTNGLTADGDTGWFCAESGAQWEVFLGTRASSTTLARTTVISSSNAGAAVNFTLPPTVFSTVPGTKIATSGPAFRARISANQSMTSGTAAFVAYNTEDFDIGGCFDTATGKFTPNVPGYYMITWLTTHESSGGNLSAATYESALYINGSRASGGVYNQPQTTTARTGGSDIAYFDGVDDYMQIRAIQSGTGTLRLAAGTDATYVAGHMVMRV